MKKLFISLCALLITSSVFATAPVNKIVFFGDSLSDNGNLYNLIGIPKNPPYTDGHVAGRFTNGPNWADYVSDHYSALFQTTSENYAYGGATVYTHDTTDDAFTAPTNLYEEIGYYLTHFHDNSHVLFSVWMGANDYLYDRTPNRKELVAKVVGDIAADIEVLINYGHARYFIVFNLPDLSETPFSHDQNLGERLKDLSQAHNAALALAVAQLQLKHPEVTFVMMDIESILTGALNNPEIYNKQYNLHISVIDKACWPYGIDQSSAAAALHKALALNPKISASNLSQVQHYIASSPDLMSTMTTNAAYEEGLLPCADPASYAFWDDVHPTTVMHQMLGNLVVRAIDEQGLIGA